VEYSIGWPVEERTLTATEQVPEHVWTAGLAATGQAAGAQVADLTGLLRHGPHGDLLAEWPDDLRVIGRRTPRPATEQVELVSSQPGGTARSPPTLRLGGSMGSMRGTAPRPTSRTRSKS
jgi:hypothetical protein